MAATNLLVPTFRPGCFSDCRPRECVMVRVEFRPRSDKLYEARDIFAGWLRERGVGGAIDFHELCVLPNEVLLSAALGQNQITHTFGVGNRIQALGGLDRGGRRNGDVPYPEDALKEILVDIDRADVARVIILV